MKTTKIILLAFLAISGGLFCDCKTEEDGLSSEGTYYSVDDLAGSWNATYATFSNAELDPPVMINVVDEGATVTLEIQTNGKFTFAISFPEEIPEISTGRLGFDEDYLVVIYDDDPEEWEYMGIQLNDDRSQMFISGPAEYDFYGDGTEEPAQASLEFERK